MATATTFASPISPPRRKAPMLLAASMQPSPQLSPSTRTRRAVKSQASMESLRDLLADKHFATDEDFSLFCNHLEVSKHKSSSSANTNNDEMSELVGSFTDYVRMAPVKGQSFCELFGSFDEQLRRRAEKQGNDKFIQAFESFREHMRVKDNTGTMTTAPVKSRSSPTAGAAIKRVKQKELREHMVNGVSASMHRHCENSTDHTAGSNSPSAVVSPSSSSPKRKIRIKVRRAADGTIPVDTLLLLEATKLQMDRQNGERKRRERRRVRNPDSRSERGTSRHSVRSSSSSSSRARAKSQSRSQAPDDKDKRRSRSSSRKRVELADRDTCRSRSVKRSNNPLEKDATPDSSIRRRATSQGRSDRLLNSNISSSRSSHVPSSPRNQSSSKNIIQRRRSRTPSAGNRDSAVSTVKGHAVEISQDIGLDSHSKSPRTIYGYQDCNNDISKDSNHSNTGKRTRSQSQARRRLTTCRDTHGASLPLDHHFDSFITGRFDEKTVPQTTPRVPARRRSCFS